MSGSNFGSTADRGEQAAAEPEPYDRPISVADALEVAVRAQRLGQRDVARTIYSRILEAAPDHPDALHFLGLLTYESGQPDEAIRLIRRAIEICPDDPGMHNNLGNILAMRRRPAEAVEAYSAAIRLGPDRVDAVANLGVALRSVGRLEEAEAAYRIVIDVDPTHREAHENLARLLLADERRDEAFVYIRRAMELEPHNASARQLLATGYSLTGDTDKAIAVLDEWLEDEPGSATAQHMRAAISGQDVPGRASNTYVEQTFDTYADSFDASLSRLGYQAPALVAAAVATACGVPDGSLSVLDAGCGTGLCAPSLVPYASRLVGVDLSARMLDGARDRGGYDELVHAELTAFMLERPDAFDLVVSADTFCYFGPLETAMAAALSSMRDGATLVFTVEELRDGDDAVRLNSHGRYCHHVDHVAAAIGGAGLDLVGITRDVLRKERGAPVAGLVVTARRRTGSAATAS